MMNASFQNSRYRSMASGPLPLFSMMLSLMATVLSFHVPFITFPNAPAPSSHSSKRSLELMLLKVENMTSGARRLICTSRDGTTMLLQYTKGVPSDTSWRMSWNRNSHGVDETMRFRQCTHGMMRSTSRPSISSDMMDSSCSTMSMNALFFPAVYDLAVVLALISISRFFTFTVASTRSLLDEATKPWRHMVCTVVLARRRKDDCKCRMRSGL
mmetsp:Transcript_5590/g.14148  ORF Transcript_5590/g.14148 Transcript_5590/m.14148 type:complete len:213 (+) Transcript_5590:200-838(+)